MCPSGGKRNTHRKPHCDQTVRLSGNVFPRSSGGEQAGEALRNCIQWLLTSDVCQASGGYSRGGGVYRGVVLSFQWKFQRRKSPDGSVLFRRWLRNQYQNNLASLRKAWWHTMKLRLRRLFLPTSVGPTDEKYGGLPDKDRAVLDTLRFHTETMADNVAYFLSNREGIERSFPAGRGVLPGTIFS